MVYTPNSFNELELKKQTFHPKTSTFLMDGWMEKKKELDGVFHLYSIIHTSRMLYYGACVIHDALTTGITRWGGLPRYVLVPPQFSDNSLRIALTSLLLFTYTVFYTIFFTSSKIVKNSVTFNPYSRSFVTFRVDFDYSKRGIGFIFSLRLGPHFYMYMYLSIITKHDFL